MGKYDGQIARSKQLLADAQKRYDEAVVSMADAAYHVREFVLNTIRKDIEEAENMIATFESAND
ncbi:hypothetical protein [Amycolatopsis orientalis]|uniref:hypothetical protein n=1 Tax=Amycolatopsis orientalis TaxID=31958 RepID=UPI001268643B|nr:hypothetical protein [Amycolatopsis orientalis]